jgi:hypothetical protein
MTPLFSIAERVPHFDKWQPDESDKSRIVAEMKDYYESTLEICGVNDEQTSEAFKLYLKVQNHTLSECKDDIQEFFADCFWAVSGDISEYYTQGLCDLINLTISPGIEMEEIPIAEGKF